MSATFTVGSDESRHQGFDMQTPDFEPYDKSDNTLLSYQLVPPLPDIVIKFLNERVLGGTIRGHHRGPGLDSTFFTTADGTHRRCGSYFS